MFSSFRKETRRANSVAMKSHFLVINETIEIRARKELRIPLVGNAPVMSVDFDAYTATGL